MSKRENIETEAPKHGDPLHLKHRPNRLSTVMGQDAVVKSLQAALAAKHRPHCFLFTGPPGTGKTTLARIVARELGITDAVIEVDAASNSGIDEMRALTAPLRYQGFGDAPNKAVILNECQGLSKQAWDSLLTTTEEPPEHVFFFFTSTNPEKIPKAMVTRCQAYHLKPLGFDDLLDILEAVADDERLLASDATLKKIARASEGSARAALTLLAKVAGVEDDDLVDELLATPTENATVIELCRALVGGSLDWKTLTATLKDLEGQGHTAESIRLVVVNYLSSCLMGAKGDKQVVVLLEKLECFMKPAGNASEKMAPLLIAFGRYIYP